MTRNKAGTEWVKEPSGTRTLQGQRPCGRKRQVQSPWWGDGRGRGIREKEERGSGRRWDSQERTDWGPYRPLREAALSWGQSCQHGLGRGSDQIRLVFEEKPYSFLAFSLLCELRVFSSLTSSFLDAFFLIWPFSGSQIYQYFYDFRVSYCIRFVV